MLARWRVALVSSVFAVALAVMLTTPRGHAASPARGSFTVVTYNVAGLPEGLSTSRPVSNLPVIGERLNRYDLALVQEDYAYPALLRKRLVLPFVSPGFVPGDSHHFGDGLSQFSRFALEPARRSAWKACNGFVDAFFDCLTPKGLAMTRAELAPGIVLDVYNVHLDAGRSAADRQARAKQLAQLTETVRALSGDRALLIGGDFNLSFAERPQLAALEANLGVRDVCSTLGCSEPQRIDRILLRGSSTLELRPRSWQAERGFRDAKGRPLSDHLPVTVRVDWKS